MTGSGFDEEETVKVGPGPAKAPRKRSEARPGGGSRATVPGEKPGAAVVAASADLQAGMVEGRVRELEAEEEKAKAVRGRLATQYKFQMVQRGEDKTALRDDLSRIVETAWVENMEAVWKRLKANLRLGVKRRSHSALARALDDARQIQFEASSLYATARREKARWESENDVSHGAMWNAATKVLQAERDTGLRSKTITNEDTKAMAATLFPDEWVAQETRKKEIELVVDLIGKLATAAGERAEDLRVLLGKHRG